MSGDITIDGDPVDLFKKGMRQMAVAELIRAAMLKQGLRNQDLVDICGTRARASEIVSGRRAVPKSMAIPLSKRLKVPLAKLIV